LIREASTHAERRRNDEHEKIFQFEEEIKNCCQLIDENQSINSVFTDQKVSRLNQHLVRLICHANSLQFLILKKTA
jgi:hypothetical protein